MAPSSGLWSSVGLAAVKNAFKSQSKLIKSRVAEFTGRVAGAEVKPVTVPARQALHPIARLRQSQGRWYTTHSINAAVRRFISTSTPKYDRSSYPKSATSRAVNALTTRTPFASTLRPNLSGALPRTAGGYCLGSGRIGGVRHFSHTPAAPAQVIHNVSNAFRAFALSGQKVQYDGMTARNEKRYRTVSKLQKETATKMQSIPKVIPGSYIDFQVNPTITALSPLQKSLAGRAAAFESDDLTINTEGFLDILSVDFARALQDLAAITNDLKRLSTLGDLSITMENKTTLRVHFPGCDAETVENLCDEIGIQRGIVHQDLDFDASVGGQVALKFPYAPVSEYAFSSPAGSLRSQAGHEFDEDVEEYSDPFKNSWASSPEGFTIIDELSESGSQYFSKGSDDHNSAEYLDGINRFLEFCETSKRI